MISESAKTLATGGHSEVLVIGSGAGGAVTAYELARAGYSVTVLEAGPHVPSSGFTEHLPSSFEQLYTDAGTQTNSDGDITILQGRCLGGSTVVNATVAFRIPPWVLAQWAELHGVEGFSAAELEPLYTRIEADLAIHENGPHEINRNSQLMQAGAEKLGWRVAPLKRNIKHCALSGYCLAGCRYDRKQSMLVTYLPWAQQRGARVICDAPVTRILHADGRARGAAIAGPAGDLEFTADLVVLAAGAIASPLLLQDSGLGGEQAGRHFACHPSLSVMARFDEKVEMWDGAQLGVYVDEFDADERGGFLLEGGGIEPSIFAAGVPGEGAILRDRMAAADGIASMVTLIHDQGVGRVYRKDGRKRIDYRLAPADRERARAALQAAAEIWFAAGAREVYLPTVLPSAVGPAEARARINALDFSPGSLMFSAYHPQGTCRMGRDPADSVVNSRGQLHGMANLMIADASLFPSSVLVNTQLPVYVTAARLTERVLAEPAAYGLRESAEHDIAMSRRAS